MTAVSFRAVESGAEAHQLKPDDRGSLGQSRIWHLHTGPRDAFDRQRVKSPRDVYLANKTER